MLVITCCKYQIGASLWNKKCISRTWIQAVLEVKKKYLCRSTSIVLPIVLLWFGNNRVQWSKKHKQWGDQTGFKQNSRLANLYWRRKKKAKKGPIFTFHTVFDLHIWFGKSLKCSLIFLFLLPFVSPSFYFLTPPSDTYTQTSRSKHTYYPRMPHIHPFFFISTKHTHTLCPMSECDCGNLVLTWRVPTTINKHINNHNNVLVCLQPDYLCVLPFRILL